MLKNCFSSWLFILLALANFSVIGQRTIPNDFISPIGIPILLSGNFGELRTNHFHTGLDIKTNGKINYKIYAIEEGFVSRINISHWGYGKAIYVDHPNGYTSVYAHLDHFPPKIEKFIRNQQYKKQSEIITFYPKMDLIKVEKGEVIAFSGNTGSSSGPHLHFEIRETVSEHPVNPHLFEFDVVDTRSPVVSKLKLYPMDNSCINSSSKETNFPLKKIKGDYYLQTDSVIRVNGKFGIGVSALDYYDNSHSKFGIYAIKVWLDDQLKFKQEINELDFSTSKQINIHKDFNAYYSKRESIHKTFIHPLNTLSIYDRDLGNGIMEIEDENLHQVTIEVADYNKNKSKVVFYVKRDTGTNCNNTKQTSNKTLSSLKTLISKDSSCYVYLDSTKLYDYHNLKFHFSEKKLLQLASKEIPLKEKFIISLKLKDFPGIDKNKWLLAHVDQRGRVRNRKGEVEGDWLKASVNHFGNFKLMLDTVAPKLSYLDKSNLKKFNQTLNFKLTDNLSGVADYDVFIDGKWVMSNYSFKSTKLSIPLNKYADIQPGEHNCKVIVKDERNNETNYEFNFSLLED